MGIPARQRKTNFSLSNTSIALAGLVIGAFFFKVLFDNFYLSISTLTGDNAILSQWTTGATMVTVMFAAAVIVVGAVFIEFNRKTSNLQRVTAMSPSARRKSAITCLIALALLVAAQIGIILAAWLIESGRFAEGATIALNGYPIEFLSESSFPRMFGVLMSNGGILFGVYLLLPEPKQPSETTT